MIIYAFLFILAIIFALLLKGIERIVIARMQSRIGPPIIQPFLDIRKLIAKECIVPENAVRWLFESMPVLALVSSLSLLLYIPLFGKQPLLNSCGDLILVIYLLVFPSLALIIGGFSSSSPYATVGAQREMVKLLSYELPLSIVVVSIGWLLTANNIPNGFMLTTVMNNSPWTLVSPIGFIGLMFLFISLILIIPAEIDRLPFDIAEAKTEIASGVLVEYSGRNLALFYIADALRMFVIACLVVSLFLQNSISNILGLSGTIGTVIDMVFWMIKMVIIVFISIIFIGSITARLKIDQTVRFYWIYTTLIAFIGMLLLIIDKTRW